MAPTGCSLRMRWMRWWPYWTTCAQPQWRRDRPVCFTLRVALRLPNSCGGDNEPIRVAGKRALRADLEEEAWDSLYRRTSRPWPAPETGGIAVKVINHYGDAVMKVLEVKVRPG